MLNDKITLLMSTIAFYYGNALKSAKKVEKNFLIKKGEY